MNNPQPEVFTVKEAAAFLQVSATHLYTLINQGQIPHGRFGDSIRISRRKLEEMLEEGSPPD